jgi:hypothetical protein
MFEIDKRERDLVINNVKNTIGYAETKDRAVFLDGASVGFYKTKEFYEDSIKNLNNFIKNV